MRRSAIGSVGVVLVGALLAASCSDGDGAGDDGDATAPPSAAASEQVTVPAESEVGTGGDRVPDASDGDESADDRPGSTSEPSTVQPPATDTAPAQPVDEGGADVKPEPRRVADEVAAPAGVRPDGFTTVTARVTSADGEVCEVCLWLADTAEERARGLMGVTDLGDPVGMVFRFDEPISGRFWMFGTPMPLSIGWFSAEGDHVGDADMEPCLTDDSATCERYGPGAAYLHAVEVVQGELDVIGIGPGARLEVLDESPTCEI